MTNEKIFFQQSDVSFWGVVAMLSGAAAMLSLTLSAFLPPSIVGGLHASRLSGGSLNQLMAQVSRLNERQVQMLTQTNQLGTRLSMAERGNGEVVRRVGALETTIPMLLEVVPPGAEIDPLSVTAAIEDPKSTSFEAEGGSVTVSRRALFASPDEQALPPPLAPVAPSANSIGSQSTNDAPPSTDKSAPKTTPASLPASEVSANVKNSSTKRYGIAIGKVLSGNGAKDGKTAWQNLSAKIGMLLIGLEPSIYDPQQNGKNRIIAGPIDDYAETEMLCSKIARVGIDCLPVQYQPDAALPI